MWIQFSTRARARTHAQLFAVVCLVLGATAVMAPSAFAAQPCGSDMPTSKIVTGSEMPDPNNPGEFIEWAPTPPQPEMAVSDLAGTAAVPTAQQAADETDAIMRDQVGLLYLPDDGDSAAQRANDESMAASLG